MSVCMSVTSASRATPIEMKLFGGVYSGAQRTVAGLGSPRQWHLDAAHADLPVVDVLNFFRKGRHRAMWSLTTSICSNLFRVGSVREIRLARTLLYALPCLWNQQFVYLWLPSSRSYHIFYELTLLRSQLSFYRAMPFIRGTSHGLVSVCPSVRSSVRLSVTSRRSTKTAKRKITQT